MTTVHHRNATVKGQRLFYREAGLVLAGGQQADASIDEADVRAAVAALPGARRQVLTGIYYRDRSVTETRVSCRSRLARSDHALSMGCAR